MAVTSKPHASGGASIENDVDVPRVEAADRSNGAVKGHGQVRGERRRRRRHPLESAVVGVLAFNEEETIEACLRAILADENGSPRVRSVVVVSSGSTDRTEEIVAQVARSDPRVRLLVERERSGKA